MWRCPIDLENFGLFTQALAEADAGGWGKIDLLEQAGAAHLRAVIRPLDITS